MSVTRHYAISTGFGPESSSIECVCGWKTETFFNETANRRFRTHLIKSAAAMESEAAKDDLAFVEFPQ